MADNLEEKKPKLENYIAYGLSFGLLSGSLLYSIGTMLGYTSIAVVSLGMGLSLGLLTGALIYLLKNRKT